MAYKCKVRSSVRIHTLLVFFFLEGGRLEVSCCTIRLIWNFGESTQERHCVLHKNVQTKLRQWRFSKWSLTSFKMFFVIVSFVFSFTFICCTFKFIPLFKSRYKEIHQMKNVALYCRLKSSNLACYENTKTFPNGNEIAITWLNLEKSSIDFARISIIWEI